MRNWIDDYVPPHAIADSSLVVPAGTLPRLLDRLSELGYAVEVIDVSSDPLAMIPERLTLYQIGERERRLHEALSVSRRGVIRLPRGRRRSAAIRAIALTFPAARIFVACVRVADVERLASDLSPEFGQTVVAARGLGWRSDARIVLGTTAALRGCDYREFRVLVFEDGLDAMGDAIVAERPYFNSHSVYAFVEPQARLSDRERLLLDAIAGPDIYAHRRAGASGSARFCFAATRGREAVRMPRGDALTQARRIWDCEPRNGTIANVADAVSRRDRGWLMEHGLVLDVDPLFSSHAPPPIVSVLVDSPLHARRLGRLLDDWTELDANSSERSDRFVTSWDRWILPTRSIVTAAYAEDHPAFHPHVLVVATGRGAIRLPSGLFRPGSSTLLVDFEGIDPPFARAAEARREAYLRLGALPFGTEFTHRPVS